MFLVLPRRKIEMMSPWNEMHVEPWRCLFLESFTLWSWNVTMRSFQDFFVKDCFATRNDLTDVRIFFFFKKKLTMRTWILRLRWPVSLGGTYEIGIVCTNRTSYHQWWSMGATLIIDDPELLPVLPGTHLPTSEG